MPSRGSRPSPSRRATDCCGSGGDHVSADADAMYKGLLEAAPDAIICVDTDGCILLVNAQVEELFGYSPDELVGNSVETLIPQRAVDQHPHLRAKYVADPKARPMGTGMELAGKRKDGSEFPAEISLSVFETETGT